MDQPSIATVVALLVLLASMASVEPGISVALIEISLGVVAGNFLGLSSPAWMDFLAGPVGIVLTFLAGAEVDPDLLRERLKESVLIGGLSFLLPFGGAAVVCYYGLGWSANAALIAGTALSTTSLAVVYAVLVETGLTETMIGKIIMASTFVTDFGTALALSVLFLRPTWWLLPFVLVSGGIIWAMPRLHPWFFPRYGNRVIEPEIKGALAALLVLLLAVKQVTKVLAVYPVARRYLRADAIYTTLLMSTGLAFGTISSLFGLQAGYVTTAQFSVLVTVVVLSAIIPTLSSGSWGIPTFLAGSWGVLPRTWPGWRHAP